MGDKIEETVDELGGLNSGAQSIEAVRVGKFRGDISLCYGDQRYHQ